MLRLTWRKAPIPPRMLDENELIGEIEAMAAEGFATAPSGPVTVEGFDAQSRILWQGHYASAAQMTSLLQQLLYERNVRGGAAR